MPSYAGDGSDCTGGLRDWCSGCSVAYAELGVSYSDVCGGESLP